MGEEEEETRQRTECDLKGGRRRGRETARQTNRANVLIHALAQKQGLLLRNPTNVALGKGPRQNMHKYIHTCISTLSRNYMSH